jgi:hypothetical protein
MLYSIPNYDAWKLKGLTDEGPELEEDTILLWAFSYGDGFSYEAYTDLSDMADGIAEHFEDLTAFDIVRIEVTKTDEYHAVDQDGNRFLID